MAVGVGTRMAAVTNVRRMELPDPQAPSRGALVANFTRGACSAAAFAETLATDRHRYAGFNLLLWDGDELIFTDNRSDTHWRSLSTGVHAVSNATLDTPWPKLCRLRDAMTTLVATDGDPVNLFSALADDQPAADADLPDTGIGLEHERFLSPPFIRGRDYGTRASTVLMVPAGSGAATLIERRFGPEGAALGESRWTVPRR